MRVGILTVCLIVVVTMFITTPQSAHSYQVAEHMPAFEEPDHRVAEVEGMILAEEPHPLAPNEDLPPREGAGQQQQQQNTDRHAQQQQQHPSSNKNSAQQHHHSHNEKHESASHHHHHKKAERRSKHDVRDYFAGYLPGSAGAGKQIHVSECTDPRCNDCQAGKPLPQGACHKEDDGFAQKAVCAPAPMGPDGRKKFCVQQYLYHAPTCDSKRIHSSAPRECDSCLENKHFMGVEYLKFTDCANSSSNNGMFTVLSKCDKGCYNCQHKTQVHTNQCIMPPQGSFHKPAMLYEAPMPCGGRLVISSYNFSSHNCSGTPYKFQTEFQDSCYSTFQRRKEGEREVIIRGLKYHCE